MSGTVSGEAGGELDLEDEVERVLLAFENNGYPRKHVVRIERIQVLLSTTYCFIFWLQWYT